MRRRIHALAPLAAYAVLALAATWPLARGLTRDVPADLGDPLLNAWVLAWDASHLWRALTGDLSALRGYWHANIFHPHPLTLAYSEHLTAQALLILPVYVLTGNALLCYNLLFLATFVLSAFGTFLLVRDLTGHRSAAFLAGLAFGFAPYRFGALSHVQVLSSMWMPFTLWGVLRYLETRRAWPLAGGALAWLAQNLSCGYFLLFFSPIVALFAALQVTARGLWRDRRVLGHLAGAAIGVTAVTVPFLVPYARLRAAGFAARPLDEIRQFSADVYGYLTADPVVHLWGGLAREWPSPENALFPGLTIVVLAAVALGAEWRRSVRALAATRAVERLSIAVRALGAALAASAAALVALLLGWTLTWSRDPLALRVTSLERVVVITAGLAATLLWTSPSCREAARRWVTSATGIFATLTLAALILSLGPSVHSHGRVIGDWAPYLPLPAVDVPGYDGLRVPARFAMIAALGLAVLAGCGAAALARGRSGALIPAVASALIVVESWSVPIPLNVNATDYTQSGLAPLPDRVAVGAGTPAVYEAVSRLDPGAALIEFPFGEVAFDLRYQFYSTSHWRRLVNGYSGGSPADYQLKVDLLADPWHRSHEAWQAVLDSKATHVIVHETAYLDGKGPMISAWVLSQGAREIAAVESDRVFAVVPSHDRRD